MKVLRSKFSGWCPCCRESYPEGKEIRKTPKGWGHVECPPSLPLSPPEPVKERVPPKGRCCQCGDSFYEGCVEPSDYWNGKERPLRFVCSGGRWENCMDLIGAVGTWKERNYEEL